MTRNTLSPHSIEAEESLIGAVLMDGNVLDDVADRVQARDFFEVKHGWIWGAILSLHDRHMAIDNVTVCDELIRRGQLDQVGGSAYITQLINSTPTFIHAETYAHIVAAAALRRRLMEAAGDIAQAARAGEMQSDELLAQAEALLTQAAGQALDRSTIALADVAAAHYALMEERHANPGGLVGLSTGFFRLDEHLDGLQPGRLYILAARPGVGKTALMLNIALALGYQQRGAVHITSLEMDEMQLYDRMAAITTGIDSKALRRGTLNADEWSRYSESTVRLSALPLFIEKVRYISPKRLRLSAMRLRRERGLGAVLVDYLQLMAADDTKGRSLYEQTSANSRALKLMALELNVPVLALAQLNRAPEGRKGGRPQLADLRDSGAIEQDADCVMFLHQEKPKDDFQGEIDSILNGGKARPMSTDEALHLIIEKQRDGRTGTINMKFDKAVQQLIEI